MSKYGCSSGNAINNIIKHGSKKEVLKSMQDRNFDVTATDSLRNTVLHSVIKNTKLKEKEKIEILELLLKCGISPNIKNAKGETALHLAVANRKKDVIDLLIEYKAQVNGNAVVYYFIEDEYKRFAHKLQSLKPNRNGDCIWNDKEMENESASFVEWLIAKGFDFDAEDKSGQSAIHLAVDYNLQYILPVLLKNSKIINYVNNYGETLLQLFLTKYHYRQVIFYDLFNNRYASKIVKILLDKGASVEAVDYSNQSALQIAIEQQKPMDIINRLVYHFPKTQDKSHLATIRLYQMLKICDSWSEERTKIYLEILSDLITKGANVNYQEELNYETPLYWAVKAGNLNAVKFLRDNGTNFRVRTKDFENLLYEVIFDSASVKIEDVDSGRSQILDIFQILLNEGCDINARDETGTTPLHVAARIRHESDKKRYISDELSEHEVHLDEDTVVMMKHYDCDPSHPYDLCYDPDYLRERKYYAKKSETNVLSNKMLVALLQKGAYVNALDEKGKSALYYAISEYLTDNVKKLLEWGADINENCVLELLPVCDYSIEPLLSNHWIKLKAANLQYSKDYSDYIEEYRNQSNYYEKCLKEIEMLKKKMITSSVSIYDFFHKDPHRRYAYVNNETLLSIINSLVLQLTYPEYSVIILAKYHEAVTRRPLLESAKSAWREFIKIYLPEICIEQLFSYLSNNDLVTITKIGDDTVKRKNLEQSLDSNDSNDSPKWKKLKYSYL